MVALAPDMAEQMHWFDCGTAPEGVLVNLDAVNDNPLPYDQCAVCGIIDDGGKWLILLRQVVDILPHLGLRPPLAREGGGFLRCYA